MSPQEFKNILHPIIFRYNGSATSGIRSAKRNAKVGGSLDSRHLQDMAEDVVLDTPNKLITIKKRKIKTSTAFKNECRRQGLIAVNEGDHIHCQTK